MEIFTRFNRIVTKVQGSQCVMSNFYPCQITVGGKTFPSAEHYYQFRKTQHHSKTALSRRILQAPTASQAKFFSKTIRPNTTWQDQRPTLIRSLLQLKFDACPEFRETVFYDRLHRAYCSRQLLGKRHPSDTRHERVWFGVSQSAEPVPATGQDDCVSVGAQFH